ncbi:hypothetical protein CDAR_441391 [Caerostris darwini]|uniref:Uncharacterized protein n=1 Tax=Caerostris darwini TaxID=1538125 RepID=A0AAV4TN51_9ARAC|nr:hypothetical protein CDAR_441391 [Caerostris darwini]
MTINKIAELLSNWSITFRGFNMRHTTRASLESVSENRPSCIDRFLSRPFPLPPPFTPGEEGLEENSVTDDLHRHNGRKEIVMQRPRLVITRNIDQWALLVYSSYWNADTRHLLGAIPWETLAVLYLMRFWKCSLSEIASCSDWGNSICH